MIEPLLLSVLLCLPGVLSVCDLYERITPRDTVQVHCDCFVCSFSSNDISSSLSGERQNR